MSQPQRKSGGGCGMGCCGCFGSCAFAVVALVVVCALGAGGLLYYLSNNSPQPLIANFTPNAASASQFETAIAQAATTVKQGGQFQLQFSETQVSSWMNLEMERNTQGESALKNLQVQFRNDQITLYGEWDTDLGKVGMLLDAGYRVNEAGQIEIAINEIDFGGIGLPQSVKDGLSDSIQQAIDEELRKINPAYRVFSIKANDGVLSISGTTGS